MLCLHDDVPIIPATAANASWKWLPVSELNLCTCLVIALSSKKKKKLCLYAANDNLIFSEIAKD